MPKIVTPLSLGQVKSAKPKDKVYKLPDGGGLALWVLPSGSKSWRLTYTRPEDKKQDTLTLGLYPDFSLADAREWRDEVRAKLARGQNPKTTNEKIIDEKYLFENCLTKWHSHWETQDGKTGEGKSKKYAQQVLAAIQLNIEPTFKGRDIRTIETAEIVEAFRIMEERGVLEYLKRTKGSLGQMFDYFVADGTLKHNPVSIIGKQVFKKPKKGHFAALHWTELPLLIDRLENSKGVGLRARLLIYWQLLSMTRPNEAAEVPIAEIDLEKGLWEIPIARMKTRPHVVPLSSALKQIYREAMEINVSGVYLFEGAGFKKPMHIETARIKLQTKMGLNTTGHGLRALARTYLREQYQIPHDVGELLLSHAVGDATEQAYSRLELVEERLKFLELLGNDVMALREKYRKNR